MQARWVVEDRKRAAVAPTLGHPLLGHDSWSMLAAVAGLGQHGASLGQPAPAAGWGVGAGGLGAGESAPATPPRLDYNPSPEPQPVGAWAMVTGAVMQASPFHSYNSYNASPPAAMLGVGTHPSTWGSQQQAGSPYPHTQKHQGSPPPHSQQRQGSPYLYTQQQGSAYPYTQYQAGSPYSQQQHPYSQHSALHTPPLSPTHVRASSQSLAPHTAHAISWAEAGGWGGTMWPAGVVGVAVEVSRQVSLPSLDFRFSGAYIVAMHKA